MLLSMLLSLSGCSQEALNILRTKKKTPFTTTSLANLQNMSQGDALTLQRSKIGKLRQTALRDTAMSIGARSGLAWQAKRVDNYLEENRIALDQIYNFDILLMHHNVLPPILSEGHNTVHIADKRTIRIADRMYKIEQQARFVSAPPHWRDYLYLNFKAPEPPDASMLPRTRAEAKIWRHFVAKGWREGIQQANTIFANSVARLTAQFQGMLLYRKLLALHMVSPPFVAKTELGVIGGGDELTINDQVLRITALPQLQANSKKWQPAVAH